MEVAMGASKDNKKAPKDRKGSLGKSAATLFTAAMILGTGLFVSLGAAAAEAGSGILVAMMIGGVICFATGICAAQVGVSYPIAAALLSGLGNSAIQPSASLRVAHTSLKESSDWGLSPSDSRHTQRRLFRDCRYHLRQVLRWLLLLY